jgi:hypothetical protein
MARKFLQMGYTRARRYANHRSGRKYAPDSHEVLEREPDAQKAAAAEIFRRRWQCVRSDPAYLAAARRHRQRFER